MKLTIVLSFLLILSSFLVLSHTHGKVVAAWLFDEGARGIGKTASGIIEDVSGNGHDGEIIGEVRWQPGKFRTALEFFPDPASGEAQNWGHVVVPHHDDLNLEEFTMTAWIKVPELLEPFLVQKKISVSQAILGKIEPHLNVNLSNYAMWISGDGGQLNLDSGLKGHFTPGFHILRPGWDQIFMEKKTREVTDGQWHFVAGTYKVPMLLAYVDGDEVGRQQNKEQPFGRIQIQPKPAFVPDGPFIIGARLRPPNPNPRLPGQGTAGIIDEVAIFDTALSQEDLRDIMNVGLADKYEEIRAVDHQGKLATTWGKIKAKN